MSQRRKIGRPTVITEEVAQAIFARIEAGESIAAITREDGFPNSCTIYRRVESDDVFRARFNWALMVRSELWAEQIVSISDSIKGSTSMEEINAAKLMVNSRQWIVSRLMAKKYGDAPTSSLSLNAITNNFLNVSEEQQREIQERTRRLLSEGNVASTAIEGQDRFKRISLDSGDFNGTTSPNN